MITEALRVSPGIHFERWAAHDAKPVSQLIVVLDAQSDVIRFQLESVEPGSIEGAKAAYALAVRSTVYSSEVAMLIAAAEEAIHLIDNARTERAKPAQWHAGYQMALDDLRGSASLQVLRDRVAAIQKFMAREAVGGSAATHGA